MSADRLATSPTNLSDLPLDQQIHVLVGLLNRKQHELTLVTEQLQAVQSAYFATKAELLTTVEQMQALLPVLKETTDLRAKLDALQAQVENARPTPVDDPKRKAA